MARFHRYTNFIPSRYNCVIFLQRMPTLALWKTLVPTNQCSFVANMCAIILSSLNLGNLFYLYVTTYLLAFDLVPRVFCHDEIKSMMLNSHHTHI